MKVDDSSDALLPPGASPERVVATWWDGLSRAERLSAAREVHPMMWDAFDWDCPWEDLTPVTQQSHLHMYYDFVVRHQAVGGSAKPPSHKPS